MIPYSRQPLFFFDSGQISIAGFISEASQNLEHKTVESFGEEWKKFKNFSEEEIRIAGEQYFDIVDESILNKQTVALDLGCGTGRWSKFIAPKVKFIEAVDPSMAVLTAQKTLEPFNNVRVTQAAADNLPFAHESFDFIFSLGVLHHIPDTSKALNEAVTRLKKNGHFLLYIYYALDSRGFLFRTLFKVSDWIRKIISSLPHPIKHFLCDIIAVVVYMPLIILARIFKGLGMNFYKRLPLSYYCDKSFYIIRNDVLDRFGTPLEQRFTKQEIENMMTQAGLGNIRFSEHQPYWHAIGRKV
jgi:ubiquinone/menaquinone biosynthesis C-methylase UbiE